MLLPDGALGRRATAATSSCVGEPMEEVTYLDRAALVAYDLPPGWQMALDERKAIAGALPTGAPIFYPRGAAARARRERPRRRRDRRR